MAPFLLGRVLLWRVFFGRLFGFLRRVFVWRVGRIDGSFVLFIVKPFCELLFDMIAIFSRFAIIRVQNEDFCEVRNGVSPMEGDVLYCFGVAFQV